MQSSNCDKFKNNRISFSGFVPDNNHGYTPFIVGIFTISRTELQNILSLALTRICSICSLLINPLAFMSSSSSRVISTCSTNTCRFFRRHRRSKSSIAAGRDLDSGRQNTKNINTIFNSDFVVNFDFQYK